MNAYDLYVEDILVMNNAPFQAPSKLLPTGEKYYINTTSSSIIGPTDITEVHLRMEGQGGAMVEFSYDILNTSFTHNPKSAWIRRLAPIMRTRSPKTPLRTSTPRRSI